VKAGMVASGSVPSADSHSVTCVEDWQSALVADKIRRPCAITERTDMDLLLAWGKGDDAKLFSFLRFED